MGGSCRGDTVNQLEVRILLECILVHFEFCQTYRRFLLTDKSYCGSLTIDQFDLGEMIKT